MIRDKVTIIAEAGVNHNGSVVNAVELVKVAAKAGADIVKFQTFKTSLCISSNTAKAAYQVCTTGGDESQAEMVRKLELSPNDHALIYSACREYGIEFLSTPFDLPSIELLASLQLERWKIPSGEITNLPYLRKIGAMGQPVILSTGMANLGEIESALAVLEQAGTLRSQITVLHCTTEYPAPPMEVNLRAMQTIAQAFGVEVGYSDHTQGIEVPIAAVAMGATVIEKHLTLDRNLPGPDHQASLEPEVFSAMVSSIRTIEQALGDGIKRPTISEKANLPLVRKSLVAARPIRAGELFSEANITAKRPGSGISPMLWDAWIGRPASRDFTTDELIA
jgi:N,N'-diacetyllegionaminate synthase